MSGLIIQKNMPNCKYADVSLSTFKANSTTMRQLDISYPTIEFTKLVKSWDGYQADKMGIILRHVKAKDLPFFVKPAMPKKVGAAGTKTAKGKSLKRAKSEKVSKRVSGKCSRIWLGVG